MGHFIIIQQKLEEFIRKYYTSELIKGIILFVALGALYFLLTLLAEYYLWLGPIGRSILFWAFILVELLLFARFIVYPISKLLKLHKGIDHIQAAKIIGNHFPEVSDKLLNVIQLNQNQRESELLAASIDQKSTELNPIPFKNAITFRKNLKYFKYAVVPAVIFILFYLIGGMDIFSSSYERVVNYNVAYEPPAPFSFLLLNENLSVVEDKNFTLNVRTVGNIIPESANISYNGEDYVLQQKAPGIFEYTFVRPKEPVVFNLSANKVRSKDYRLDLILAPTLLEFAMLLDYPKYTGKQSQTLKSTGNATIPEGTRVTWTVNARNTTQVHLQNKDSVYNFLVNSGLFKFQASIYNRMNYAITTTNEKLKDYENLAFDMNVIKDEFPEIEVQTKTDSISGHQILFLGKVSDDYGLTKLRLVYYPEDKPEEPLMESLPLNRANFDQFTYSFPGNLPLMEGVPYSYYFEVFDNDAVHNFKAAKSGIYSYRKLFQDEEENLKLQQQENSINGLDKSLDKLKDQDKTLEDLAKTQKEKTELNYNDKQKLQNFISRQKQQEEIMKKFSNDMKENLENFQPEKKEKDFFKEQLQERLKENEERLKENEKLLDELEKLQDRIKKEDLTEKLDKLSKQNKNQEKNIEQLLELTKRYYVAKKAEKLAEELYKMGEDQERLADSPKEENTEEEQNDLNEKFEEHKDEMEQLQKDNDKLKDPMEIGEDKFGEKEVTQDQKQASDKLKKQDKEGASQNQKKAGKKMKQMSEQMQSEMMSGQMKTLDEDVEMLRQILDNLVVFSLEQEDLMENFKKIEYGNPIFGKKLNIQNDLKLNFQHVDDSLFSLSLRQPMISAPINTALTEVSYNIDKALERLAQNEIRQGVSSQQYTVKGANDLAVLLSDLLSNMEMQMQMMGKGSGGGGQGSSEGEGEGRGFQLPDIIKKQQSLAEGMKKGMDKGKIGKGEDEGEGEGKGKGEGEGEGEGKGNDKGKGQGDGQGEGDGGGGDGKNGQKDGKMGNGEGNNEEINGEIYEIYKQQQDLRNQLEERLSKEGLKGNAGLLRKMEGIERQLLDKGFNQGTLQEMLNLKYELLKLDKADFEQGQEDRRESETNKRSYQNDLRIAPEDIKKYFNSVEILNREALPLRQEYKNKVQEYFKKTND